MQLPMFQVDAFADRTFAGNPAAVVLLEGDWLPDQVMQEVAAENNLAETAFVAPAAAEVDAAAADFGLRWFTPTVEVELCGHATLAAGHVVLRHLAPDATTVTFATRWAGNLEVRLEDSGDLTVALPLDPPRGPAAPEVAHAVAAALGAAPLEVLEASATIARFATAEEVAALDPDFRAVGALDAPWVVATAPGTGDHQDQDWVCRYFAPGSGIDEDHVTGSAQTYLAAHWWPELTDPGRGASVVQLSRRGGRLLVRRATAADGEVVLLTGGVADYLEGTITVPLPDDHSGPR